MQQQRPAHPQSVVGRCSVVRIRNVLADMPVLRLMTTPELRELVPTVMILGNMEPRRLYALCRDTGCLW